MHDQIFWSADRDAFSPFQRVTSAVVSSLVIVAVVVGLVAASGFSLT